MGRTTVAEPTTLEIGVHHVALAKLRPAPDNPRDTLRDVEELAESFLRSGQLQAAVVTTEGIIVAGHRRLAAGQRAEVLASERGLPPFTTLLCDVREMSNEARIEAMVVENAQRDDLTPTEEARGYQQMLDLGLTVEDVATRTRMREQRVRERLALLKLPMSAQLALREGHLTLGNALAVARLDNKRRDEVCKRVTDDLIGEHQYEPAKAWAGIVPEVAAAESEMRDEEARIAARRKLPKDTNIIDDCWSGHVETEWNGHYNSPSGRFRGTRRIVAAVHRPHEEAAFDPKAHAKLPCHAVCITRGGKVVPFCTDPAAHGDTTATDTSPERVPERSLRQRDRDRHAAIIHATADERSLAEAKVIDELAASHGLLNAALIGALSGWEFSAEVVERHSPNAEGFVGLTEIGAQSEWTENPGRALRVLGLAFLAEPVEHCAWSNPFDDDLTGRYYELLVTHGGYVLSADEEALRAEAVDAGSGG